MKKLFIVSFFCLMGVVAEAQTGSDGNFRPHWYTGLNYSTNLIDRNVKQTNRFTGLVGYQFLPRVALQLNATYSLGMEADRISLQPYTFIIFGNKQRDFTLSASLRYDFLKANKLKFYGLAGIASTMSKGGYKLYKASDNEQDYKEYKNRSNYLTLDLGLGIRYQLTPRVSFVTEGKINYPLFQSDRPTNLYNGFTLHTGLQIELGKK